MRAGKIAVQALIGWVMWSQAGPPPEYERTWWIDSSYATYNDCVHQLSGYEAKLQKQLGPGAIVFSKSPGRLEVLNKSAKFGVVYLCLPETIDPRDRPKK